MHYDGVPALLIGRIGREEVPLLTRIAMRGEVAVDDLASHNVGAILDPLDPPIGMVMPPRRFAIGSTVEANAIVRDDADPSSDLRGHCESLRRTRSEPDGHDVLADQFIGGWAVALFESCRVECD